MALTNDEKFKIWWEAEKVRMRHESEERGSTAQDFRDMKKRNEAELKNPPPRGVKAAVAKVVDWIEAEPKKPRRARRTTRMARAESFGSNLNMRDFIPSNLGLGQRMGFEPPIARSPSKRKRKSSHPGGGNWSDPGYIPPELEWMF